jgi:hypothetical protein
MADTPTKIPIATTTLSSDQSSVTFSSISGSYTDLVLIIAGTVDVTGNVGLRFNSDSNTNYSCTILYGTGSAAGSDRVSNDTYANCGGIGTGQSNSVIHIMNYANTTTYKTILGRGNRPADQVNAKVALWRKTPEAITSMVVYPINGATVYKSGSTFTLYGIL